MDSMIPKFPPGPIVGYLDAGAQLAWQLKESHDIPEPMYFG